ncbi:hypothetical protein ACLRGI_04985 [Paenarthrobacter nitroguajacolicus]|uniref:hypothetical protein n=1 Tax=Paenarthrobacter nitroguajacolicus TaxID=211146 RepID=UPI003ADB57CB
MIRKEGKARWVYTCELCRVLAAHPDHFRAIEQQQAHEGTIEHATKPMADALGIFAESLTEMANAFVDTIASALKPLTDALATPPNVPHDPSLLRDRRKWGGR